MTLECSKKVRNRNCKLIPKKKCLDTLEYFCTKHSTHLENFTTNDERCREEGERRKNLQRRPEARPEAWAGEENFSLFARSNSLVRPRPIVHTSPPQGLPFYYEPSFSNGHSQDDPSYTAFLERTRRETQTRTNTFTNFCDQVEETLQGDEECCSICLIGISSGTEKCCTNCNVGFHDVCLELWQVITPKCPICRN